MTDPIKAALEAAGEATRKTLVKPPCHCSRAATATAIAAFLRALPDQFSMPGEHNHTCQVVGHAKGEMRRLAAAVERAAKGSS